MLQTAFVWRKAKSYYGRILKSKDFQPLLKSSSIVLQKLAKLLKPKTTKGFSGARLTCHPLFQSHSFSQSKNNDDLVFEKQHIQVHIPVHAVFPACVVVHGIRFERKSRIAIDLFHATACLASDFHGQLAIMRYMFQCRDVKLHVARIRR